MAYFGCGGKAYFIKVWVDFSQKEGFLNLLSNLKIYKEKLKREE